MDARSASQAYMQAPGSGKRKRFTGSGIRTKPSDGFQTTMTPADHYFHREPPFLSWSVDHIMTSADHSLRPRSQ
jgi:hypothetical protein